jgi:glucose uptake protein GlcU
MLNWFVVTGLETIILVGVGVLIAGFITPIPWKFPNWSRQIILNKVAGYAVAISAIVLALGKWIGFAL